MAANMRALFPPFFIASCAIMISASASVGQERYTPAKPTVSPYLNLFQNNRNGSFNRALPNYYTLVRPQLEQNRINANQQNLNQQQNSTIEELQANVHVLQHQPTPTVVTGHSSWFFNTSRYYSQAGSGGMGRSPGQSSSYRPTQTSAARHR
jgi:hypothetical protein